MLGLVSHPPFGFAVLGGALIGVASALMLVGDGRIAGISGIFGGALVPEDSRDAGWRWVFLAGLLAGGMLTGVLRPDLFHDALRRPAGLVVLAGILVGLGSQLANGCTSGHGVCGLSRLSPRSFVAVAMFIVMGAVSVFVLNHVFGLAPQTP